MGGARATELDSVVIFRLGGEAFGMPVEAVREVVPIAWLAKPPQLPSLVEGILNLGGIAVPVLKLDQVLGLAGARYGLDASILIMKGDAPLGLLVEHVDGVRRLEA
ncbi:MAG TPA: chemotaxis protein CheW, partial [Candidatus Omnitrophota bacterium]|nr:chemotaxis protein CheW [Candidatus Omnitrophota bacterium]